MNDHVREPREGRQASSNGITGGEAAATGQAMDTHDDAVPGTSRAPFVSPFVVRIADANVVTPPVTTVLTETDVREPLRALLARRTSVRAPRGSGKASAVLLPLAMIDGAVHAWFVKRPKTLRDHAGQIAFPGGKRDPEDPSLRATALREAEEEIGLAAADVDVLGELDDYITITGFTITPYVGWVASGFEPRPNPAEVARAFAAPLATFLDAPTGEFPWTGYMIDGELLWGATSSIARGLGGLVEELASPRT